PPSLSVKTAGLGEPEVVFGFERELRRFKPQEGRSGDSGDVLERRVIELTGQLAEAGLQRLQELDEKERLAKRLQSLVDLLPGGVIVIDWHGVVGEATSVAVELFGVSMFGQLRRDVIALSFAPRKVYGHEISL